MGQGASRVQWRNTRPGQFSRAHLAPGGPLLPASLLKPPQLGPPSALSAQLARGPQGRPRATTVIYTATHSFHFLGKVG